MEQEEIKISANVSDNNVNYKMDLPLKDLISDEFIEDHDVTSQNVISTTDCASSEASPSETDANKEQSKLNQEILQESTNNITPENRSAETNAADTSAAETSSANTEAEPVQAESTVPEKPTSEATSESEGAHIVQENVDELDDASEQEIKTVQDEGERVEITELVTEESTDDANVPTVDKVNSVTEEKNVETSEILIDIDAAAPNDVTENDAVSEKAGVDIADEKEQENDNPTVFVQVNDENEKEGSDENDKYDNEAHKDMLEDPIASADIFDQLNEDREGADEELCIIPDTERVISQAEKDAASSIPPLRDIVEVSASLDIISDKEKSIEDSSSPFIIHKYEKDDLQKCGLRQCSAMRNVKYFYKKPDEQLEYICDDDCLQTFKSSNEQKVVLSWEEGNLRVKNFSSRDTVKELPSVIEFVRKCRACNEPLKYASSDNGEINTHLTWEIMDFCDELCLTKYQKEIGSFCSSCNASVKNNSLGKYCVRFGNDIRQFCTSHCLEEYKKGLKVCSYCQHDISGGTEGFLAPVGDKGQFKDFCSQLCMEKYDIMTNNRTPKVAVGTKCSVCNGEKPISIEFELDNKANYFCSEPCFVAFSFVNNITTGKCAMCRRSFTKKILQDHTMFYENTQHSFCSNSCQNIYIIAYRKIVPCSWCKVKKYNFDMIQKYSDDGLQLNMCSINCLNLYQLSLVSILKEQPCNFCNKVLKTLYQLNMSDTTKRSFCSYNCVWSFQNKFSNSKILASKGEDIIPVGPPRKAKKILNRLEENGSNIPALPVITNVQSLANTNGNMHPLPALTTISTRATRVKSVPPTVELPIKYKQHYILQPSPLPEQRNASIQCSVRTNTKSCSCEPVMVDKGCQTTEVEIRKILIPIPVPIYVPTPLHMFAAPVPIPVPFPLPIPIPIFIPTTRNSAMGILKEIKKIQVKIPTDPYEAELLMMAEMVAGEKKEDHTDSESDVEDSQPADDSTFSPEPVDTNSTFGDDMLQMALKMATELDEPAVDLEGALTANTITAPHGAGVTNLEVSEDQPNAPSLRGRKRTRQIKGNSSTKRGRRLSHQVDIPLMTSPVAPVPTTEPAEKPDANMCLKYTFGVNAWKQWVTTKYTELEKSSKRIKMFKTEILQLTADELNYSLCLFVKEVRKPSGAEYAPDTIYYLCLGIQQYLFENGRIDNIFCDSYYEKFTDCLDEVAKKFSVLYNESHYIVTRVEEEHLWESKQLGAHSPHVLLSTLMFFNTKHFNLTSVDEHMQLSFSHIMKHWKRNPNQPGASKVPGSRNVLLRFYPPQSAIQNNARKKKVYEQQENEENPLRCPVKLYEFYLSKCPESVKTRNDVFYLQPERSCVPDSPVWYSTMPLPRDALEKMLHRVKMVKEINVALLTS